MQTPRRLFDCLEWQLANKPLEDMLAAKEGGQWKKYSTAMVKETVDQLSAGLIAMGIGPGDRTAEGRDKIAVISKNRPEWIMLDLAVQQIGAILTPIYPTISVNELEFVLSDAAVKMVFVNDEELFLKVSSLQSKLPALKTIFTFEHVVNARHWKEVMQAATDSSRAALPSLRDAVGYEDLVTIIYTSGTTGVPKGVMLSHRNILSNTMAAKPYFPPGDNMRALSFLPLNHIFERVVTYLYAFNGTAIYYAESLETIGDNLKEIKPHLFTTVPRLLEKVYDKIMAKGNQLTGVARKLFFWAHGLAEKFEINQSLPLGYRLQLASANKIIFKKWREALGGNVKCIVTGGAACQVRLIRIFTAAKLVVMEGYGLTETSPVISVNRYDESGRAFGTVGPLIEHVEVKLAEDGEILCKGPNIMMGYYKRPDLTAEVMQGEWFCTGDIGTFSKEGFLKITDRKKELFKTSGGKYVAPLPIESKLKESPFIEQVMVVGSERKFVGALIVPAFPNLQEWVYKQGITESDPEKLIRLEPVKELYRELVESFNKFFNHVEQVKRFELLSKEWSVDTGEMTPKLSVKRKVILEKYKAAVERIYQE
ncbi:MAG: long-chain fatty acid--CoA ligase [Bacteroidetes bacterium]|nr:long-chain fatty acid--CoA ligase [Bacteroidota bacterium]